MGELLKICHLLRIPKWVQSRKRLANRTICPLALLLDSRASCWQSFSQIRLEWLESLERIPDMFSLLSLQFPTCFSLRFSGSCFSSGLYTILLFLRLYVLLGWVESKTPSSTYRFRFFSALGRRWRTWLGNQVLFCLQNSDIFFWWLMFWFGSSPS